MPATTAAAAALPAPVLPRLEPLPSAAHVGIRLCSFTHLQQHWTVYEHLDDAQGQLTVWSDSGMLRLDKRTEPAYPAEGKPYFGLPLAEVAMADADLLADRLLRDGDPDEAQVRDVAPPPASLLDPKDNGGRWPWTTFVGTRESLDTMPILPNGRSRTSRPEHAFAELGETALIKRREEGVLGGWMPAVRKVMRCEGEPDSWYDVLVFADVRARDRFVVQTWHRTMKVKAGAIVAVHYTHSYPEFAPSRSAATAEQFYAALIDFAAYWQQALDGTVQAQLPDASWNDMAQFAFARELVVRPGGDYPKYGAVERDYYGNEYDGFQDTFTSSFYANLEWGRFAQAAAVLDNYFDEFVQGRWPAEHAWAGSGAIRADLVVAGAVSALHRRCATAASLAAQDYRYRAGVVRLARPGAGIAAHRTRLWPAARLERIRCLPVSRSIAVVEAVLRQQRVDHPRLGRHCTGDGARSVAMLARPPSGSAARSNCVRGWKPACVPMCVAISRRRMWGRCPAPN